MVSFQHDGTGSIKYSFLGSSLPGYVDTIDLDGDDIPDFADIFNLGYGDSFRGFDLLEDGSVPNLGFTVQQQEGIVSAINAWNAVANIRLEPGGSAAFSSGDEGTPVTGTGALVTGLGGASDFGETELPRNDDGSFSADISSVFESGLKFFDGTHSEIFINTNGSISFNTGISTFTPETITGGSTPIIAPFWADIDTSVDTDPETPDGGPIYLDIDDVNDAVTITWAGVGYYDRRADLTNSFQLQLYDRGSGDFDIVFRYADINWTTGEASDGEDGLGGTVARMGYSAGNLRDFFELSASGSQGAVLSLDRVNGNTGVSGLWEFEVRSGGIVGDVIFAQAPLREVGSFGIRDDGEPYSIAGLSDTSSSDPAVFGIDGDVYFRDPGSRGFNFTPGEQDYWAALRAVGQALGLERPNFFSVLDFDERAPFYTTPTKNDIDLVQEIYGPNWLTRADDTVYFRPDTPFAVDNTARSFEAGLRTLPTIWDAGGDDLLDLSHTTSAITGGFGPGSSLAVIPDGGGQITFVGFANAKYTTSGLQELDVAPTNHIEAIRLGSANDSISGGDWTETLEGGLGDDILVGHKGDDILHGGYRMATRPEGFGMDGNDTLAGQEGRDTAIFDNPNTYTLILAPDKITIEDRKADGTGTDELVNVELLSFENDTFDVLANDTYNLERNDGITRISASDLNDIVELYIAYFNRAPDALGLVFWADVFADDNKTLAEVAAGFIDQPETRALYPESAGIETFVDAVYQNVLGREPDAGGRDFWLTKLEAGEVGRETFILDILRGAKVPPAPGESQEFIDLQAVDQQYLALKTQIGGYFSVHKGMSNVENANAAMQLFTREALDHAPAVNAIREYARVAEDDTFGDFLIQVQGILDDPFAM